MAPLAPLDSPMEESLRGTFQPLYLVTGQSRWKLPHWVIGSMFHVTAVRRHCTTAGHRAANRLVPGGLAEPMPTVGSVTRTLMSIRGLTMPPARRSGMATKPARSGRDGEWLSPAESTAGSSSSSSRGAAVTGPTLPRRRGARPPQRVTRPARRAGRPSRDVRHAIPAHVLCAHTHTHTAANTPLAGGSFRPRGRHRGALV